MTTVRYDRGLGHPVQRHDRIEWRVDQRARRLDNGMVDAFGVATKAGVFVYHGLDEATGERWTTRELRPTSEVMDPASLATLVGQPLTLEHPGDGPDDPGGFDNVTSSNVRELAHGWVLSVEANAPEPGLVQTLNRLASDPLLGAVDAGKTQLSCGYTAVLVEPTDPSIADLVARLGPEPGVTHDGERYDLVQTQIRYNHLAVVEQARAGPVARLRMDSMKLKKFTVKRDGKTIEAKIPTWLADAAERGKVEKAEKADQMPELKVVPVSIDGMEMMLPMSMVDMMLRAMGMGEGMMAEGMGMEGEDRGGMTEDQTPPMMERQLTDQTMMEEEPKMDAATAVAALVKRELARQIPAAITAALPEVKRNVTDSVTKASRDRAELDRKASQVLGARFDYAAADEHGIALAVLEGTESPRLSQAKELAGKARKGDSFAAGQLRSLMDVALDDHRDRQDSSGLLLEHAIHVAAQGSTKADTKAREPAYLTKQRKLRNNASKPRRTA